jgi:hypothetical protein
VLEIIEKCKQEYFDEYRPILDAEIAKKLSKLSVEEPATDEAKMKIGGD